MITVVILPGTDGTGIELTDFVAALAPELEAIVVTYPNNRPRDYAGTRGSPERACRSIGRSCFSANLRKSRERILMYTSPTWKVRTCSFKPRRPLRRGS